MLLGERVRNRCGRKEAAPHQDLAEAPTRALLLGEGIRKVLQADQVCL
jgi:hypothetical protein